MTHFSERTSMSSLGDFTAGEDLRDIINMIHTHIFFIYKDSGYNTSVLNQMINELEVYDLHRKVEYI